MKFYANTFFLVFGILFIYQFFNIPIYFQAYTYKLPIIRLQLVDAATWALSIGYLSLFLFAKKIYVWVDPKMVKVYFIWLGYSVLSTILLIRFSYQIPYYLYLLFTLLPYHVMFSLQLFGYKELDRNKLSIFIDQVINVLGKSYIPVLVFGLVQYVFKNDFIGLNTEEKTLQATSELLGSFRPRSIFNSSYEFGLFSVLVFSLYAAKLNFNRMKENSNFVLVLVLLSSVGVIISFTRNIYMIWAMVLLNLYVFKKEQIHIFVKKILPYIYTFASALLLVVLSLQALSGVMLSDFLSSESTFVRFTFLYALIEGLIVNGSMVDFLFGWGLIQHNGDSNLISIFPDIYNSEDGSLGIDNLFFSIFLNQGLIGLALYLIIYQKIWNRLCWLNKYHSSSLILGTTILFGTFLGAGVFNLINYGIFNNFLWFFAFATLALSYKVEQREMLI